MDDHIREAMAAYEPKRIEREGMERARWFWSRYLRLSWYDQS